ncbi:hypothetical protein [Caballeronia cordobensis]|uniref:hypothetical protein n=1 Tax=Caballeronia cordobensis TaxID=1353886 RepID=UPI00118593B4
MVRVARASGRIQGRENGAGVGVAGAGFAGVVGAELMTGGGTTTGGGTGLPLLSRVVPLGVGVSMLDRTSAKQKIRQAGCAGKVVL